MLAFAHKLTVTPAAMVEDDVVLLRDAGWSDAAIVCMTEVVGYYAYVNRMVSALGVALESDAEPPSSIPRAGDRT